MIFRFIGDFTKNTRGNVIMIFALLATPVLLAVALAIDSTRQVNAKKHVQYALDAASLAGILALSDPTTTDADVHRIAGSAFKANLKTSGADLGCSRQKIEIDRAKVSVKVSADCEFGAMIGGSITPETLKVAGTSKAQASTRKLDLILMLDVSGSMLNGRLDDLKTAAKQTARSLIGSAADDNVRIGFVTFSDAVNAGAYGNIALGRPANDDRDGDGLGKVCVSERVVAAAWTDDAPELGKWVGARANRCQDSTLLPLTNDLSKIDSEIDSLGRFILTAGHLGVAWSWYLLSPEWEDVWPADSRPLDYDDVDATKAVIFMTDGDFNKFYEATLGTSSEQARRLCAEMRARGIITFSVAFRAPRDANETLRDCAGSDARFYETRTGEEMLKAYASIASELSQIHIAE